MVTKSDAIRSTVLHAMPVDSALTSEDVAKRLGRKPRSIAQILRSLADGQIVDRCGKKAGRILWRNKQHVMALGDQ